MTGEYGDYRGGCTTKFIKICEALELATDLRTIDSDQVKSAVYKSVHDKLPIQQCLQELEHQFDQVPRCL